MRGEHRVDYSFCVATATDGADDGETEKLKIGGQLIEIEKRERGAVDSKVYW